MAFSQDELDGLTAHANYEIQQMRRARELVEHELDPDDPHSWLVSEAGLVHARNLLEFFRTSAEQRDRLKFKANDVVAADYGRWNWRRTRDLLMAFGTPDDLSERINGRVMHLGRERNEREPVAFVELARALDVVWVEFRKTVDQRWRDQFDA